MREIDRYKRTLTGLALKRDLATMLLDDPARNRQSQSRSSGIATTGRVGAIEPFEDVWQILWRNADSCIADGDLVPHFLAL